MKKQWILLGALGCLWTFTGCSSESEQVGGSSQPSTTQEAAPENNYTNIFGSVPARTESPTSSVEGIDIDLTELSSVMVFSEVYQMMFYPELYEGKVVRMAGQFFVYVHPDTGDYYYTAVVEDALACCQQGLEFVLKDGSYPQDYPEVGDYVVVTGEFQTYEEFGAVYFQLKDATYV